MIQVHVLSSPPAAVVMQYGQDTSVIVVLQRLPVARRDVSLVRGAYAGHNSPPLAAGAEAGPPSERPAVHDCVPAGSHPEAGSEDG